MEKAGNRKHYRVKYILATKVNREGINHKYRDIDLMEAYYNNLILLHLESPDFKTKQKLNKELNRVKAWLTIQKGG